MPKQLMKITQLQSRNDLWT